MSSRPSCDEVRELAPELALGIASGEERARALGHIATCPECRRFVGELSIAADEILLLAPQRGPSPGFENRVLAAIGSRRPRARRLAMAAAAALVAVAVGAGGVLWATRDDRELAGYYRQAFAEANGKYLAVIPMDDAAGDKAASVFAYEGEPSWVFVVWRQPLEEGDYEIQARLIDGQTITLGTFDSDGTRQTWGGNVRGSLHEMASVRVMAEESSDDYRARFPQRDG